MRWGVGVPRRAAELSALAVGRLREPGRHAVGGVAGLCLQITPDGYRTWVLRVSIGSQRREMGLGSFPEVPLAAARDRAREARSMASEGVDPIAQRKRAREALRAERAGTLTFAQAAEAFIASHGSAWRNDKHRAQWGATLEAYANPVIGRLPVAEVDQARVLAILRPIWKTKTETAVRVRGRIEQVLDWAKVQGMRTGDNPARWRGHLDKLLPPPAKIRRVKHHRALPIDDMPAFLADLRSREGISARALEFAILCASRSGEVRGALWTELDIKAAVWIVPADRMKAHREHRVPLSRQAVELLRGLHRVKGCPFVFPSTKDDKPLSDMSLTAVLRRMEVDAVPHGMRSTFRDWVAERTTFAPEVAEMALAHTIESKVEAAYRRGDLFEKRRELMQAWANYLDGGREA